MGYKIRTAVPADEGKIRELFLEMLQTIYHIENEYLKLYRAGTLSVDQLDEIRRAGLGSGGRP